MWMPTYKCGEIAVGHGGCELNRNKVDAIRQGIDSHAMLVHHI